MAYATGTATDAKDLLSKLETFLAANGWTLDASGTDGTGRRAHLHKGSDYINLRALYNETVSSSNVANGGNSTAGYAICLYIGTGYSGAAAWYAQGGGPVGNGGSLPLVACMSLPAGAVTAYHFFTNASNSCVDVVVEKSANIFGHCGWGQSLTKLGTWTGGQYFYGSSLLVYVNGTFNYNEPGFAKTALPPGVYGAQAGLNASGHLAWVKADVDSWTGKWIGIASQTGATSGGTGKNGASLTFEALTIPTELPSYTNFQTRQTSALNTQANLLPQRIAAARDSSGFSFLGSLPTVFVCTAVGNGFSAGSDYTVGPDTYKVFPGYSSAVPGFAIKKG